MEPNAEGYYVHYADYLAALNEMRENQAVLAQERDKLEEDRDGFQFVVKQFMEAMGGDTKGKPPWEKVAVWQTENATLRAQLAEANRVIADYKSALWRVTQEALDLFFDQTAVQNRIDMELKISAASRAQAQKVEDESK